MTLLKEALQRGKLHGIPILDAQPLLHQLFANDTRLFLLSLETNFTVATQVVHQYKQVSGQALTLGNQPLSH